MDKRIANLDEYQEITLSAVDEFNRSDYEGALTKFLDMAAYNQGNWKIHETLSIIYLKMGRIDEAEREFQTALELANQQKKVSLKLPTFDSIVANMEKIEILEQRYYSQENGAEEAISGSALPIQLGISYMAKGEYQKAEKLLLDHKNKKLKIVREREKDVNIL